MNSTRVTAGHGSTEKDARSLSCMHRQVDQSLAAAVPSARSAMACACAVPHADLGCHAFAVRLNCAGAGVVCNRHQQSTKACYEDCRYRCCCNQQSELLSEALLALRLSWRHNEYIPMIDSQDLL